MKSVTCKHCGKVEALRWDRSNEMLSREECFSCFHVLEDLSRLPHHPEVFVVGRQIRSAGDPTEYSKGCGGDTFVVHLGSENKIVTNSLWCGMNIPECHLDKVPACRLAEYNHLPGPVVFVHSREGVVRVSEDSGRTWRTPRKVFGRLEDYWTALTSRGYTGGLILPGDRGARWFGAFKK